MVFYCEEEKVAFSGDTLFRMSIGRTDFDRGSFEQMLASLQKLRRQLPPETTVYPGHGLVTNIGEEVQYNPYFK
jgi:glyoxylase-like metal-dependent hydrolase (beta-lactamase superfamily II)